MILVMNDTIRPLKKEDCWKIKKLKKYNYSVIYITYHFLYIGTAISQHRFVLSLIQASDIFPPMFEV